MRHILALVVLLGLLLVPNSVALADNTSQPSQTACGPYIVQPGDYLLKISRATGVPVATIKALNGLKSDTIWVNMKLNLGNCYGPPAPPPVTSCEYTVKRGDTWWGIATRYKLTVYTLQFMNPDKGMHAGNVLWVCAPHWGGK